MTLRKYAGLGGRHATNPTRAREARDRQARAARAERIERRRERRRRMDPIIGVFLIKLTARAESGEKLEPARLTNDEAGDAAAAGLQERLREIGIEAEVNATSVERTDD